jgi:hypothetical protein
VKLHNQKLDFSKIQAKANDNTRIKTDMQGDGENKTTYRMKSLYDRLAGRVTKSGSITQPRKMENKIGSKIKTVQEKMDAIQEKVDNGHEEMKAQVSSLASRIDVNQEEMKVMLDACLEKMEANLGEMQSVAVHEEVPKEEVAVIIVALKERHGDRHLDLGRRQKPKKRTQDHGGSWKKLAAACRRMARRAIPARLKGHCYQGQAKDKAVRRTQKGRTFGKRLRAKLEGSTGIRGRDLKEQLHLGSERTSGRIFRKDLVLEIVKRRVETLLRIRKRNVRTLWRGRSPPKRKKRLHTE